MINLLLGRAGTGKTSRLIDDFKRKMDAGAKRLYFIVPEQYSHDAERRLLASCGDSLTLHGEVLSFSRLASRVFSEVGGLAAPIVDSGGKLLLMWRAVSAVQAKLEALSVTERQVDLLESLVGLAKELKSAAVTPEAVSAAADALQSPLKEKLRDLSLILSVYGGFFDGEHADPDDSLTRLARVINERAPIQPTHIYFDGFSDFTQQELAVITALIRQNVPMTVSLTCDGLDGGSEIFEPARHTALELSRLAEKSGVLTSVTLCTERMNRAPALLHLENQLFTYDETCFGETNGAVICRRFASPEDECHYAASLVLAAVRGGCRWRDIAVAAPDWPSYETLLENVFQKFGIPVFAGRKEGIRQKPPIAVMTAALELLLNGWTVDSVFRYIKTGLCGLTLEEADTLENYALLWDLKGTVWTREEDWVLSPSGYEPGDKAMDEKKLVYLNALRRRLIKPLLQLKNGLFQAGSNTEKLRALYEFLTEINLYQRIQEKADAYRRVGEVQLGDEYDQLWNILLGAMEQFAAMLGSENTSIAAFKRLWELLITQYDVASIPVSLDSVTIGDVSRVRRRGLKALIILGATDDALPKAAAGGFLTDSDRTALRAVGLSGVQTAEERLYRELYGVYAVVTLPTDTLVVTHPASAFGSEKRPSFLVRRLNALFAFSESEEPNARIAAKTPCFELAVSALRQPENAWAAAAYTYFSADAQAAALLRDIAAGAHRARGALSPEASAGLYGMSPDLSASRVDKFYACRYQYFLQYGLKLRPRKQAGFDAPVAGTFLHDLLENVTRAIETSVGFQNIDDDTCRELTAQFVSRYVRETLGDFADKSGRFRYLFERLAGDAAFITGDMVRELKKSSFHPVDFELEFSESGDVAPYRMTDGSGALSIKGFVDRVDGWVRDDKLYLRVIDYKTGKKTFTLSDIWYGLNLQMLIYLFALSGGGAARYGHNIVPCGVLYAPAREELLPLGRNTDALTVEAERAKKRRRSGIILGDAAVIEAMEHGDEKQYIPAAESGSDSLVTPQQLDALKNLVDSRLRAIGQTLRAGDITAEPYYKNQNDKACLYCDYGAACQFSEKDGDAYRPLKKLRTTEVWALLEGGQAV
ncbi:PD-(D/E)XK nuclease family protein [Oscillospiraceae bacterium CM]|nr:PD-(D/E)XK nuclease family protein [Oscillospiraceae bacterium CM]